MEKSKLPTEGNWSSFNENNILKVRRPFCNVQQWIHVILTQPCWERQAESVGMASTSTTSEEQEKGLGGTQLAVWQSKLLHFSKAFLSVITTGGDFFPFVRQQLAIWVTLPWVRGGLGSFSQQIRLASLSFTARQGGRALRGLSGWMHRNQSFAFPCPPLGFPPPGDAKGNSGTLMLKDCLLSI